MTHLPFLVVWQRDTPQVEYKFHSTRRYRFDYAWPRQKVAVEFDGGQWVANGGRHNRDSDREKLLEAGAQGWIVLRFSNQQWEKEPMRCIELIEQALKTREEQPHA